MSNLNVAFCVFKKFRKELRHVAVFYMRHGNLIVRFISFFKILSDIIIAHLVA